MAAIETVAATRRLLV